MKTFARALGVSCAALIMPAACLLAADPDQEKLQGKWSIESFEYNGNQVEMMKGGVREFKGSKYVLAPKAGETIEGTVKLDSSQKPKTIDLEVNGRTLKGIYELDGDTLKLSYTLNDGERPAEFASKPDSGTTLIIHKRIK